MFVRTQYFSRVFVSRGGHTWNSRTEDRGKNYSGKNFYECVQSILKETTTTATAPIRYATKGVMKVQQSKLNAIRGVRHQVNYIRNNMTKTVKNIMTRLVGFLILHH